MRIVIAGGHGKIAMRLARLLAGRGDVAVGLIRNPAQGHDLTQAGATPLVCDLEQASAGEVAAGLRGADAAVFAAGAGPGSGIARKDSVDRAAAELFAEAAQRAGVRRFLQVSSINVDRAPAEHGGDVFTAYLIAKRAAEEDLRGRDLDWTIVRPGRLTDDPGTRHVTLTRPPVEGGDIPRDVPRDVPRDDVAAVLAALLDAPHTYRTTLELVGGPTPIQRAVAELGEDAGR